MRPPLKATFRIEERAFCSEPKEPFSVKSIPRPYSVIWDEEPSPGKKIQQELDEKAGSLLLIDEKVYDLYGSQISHPPEKIHKIHASEETKTLDGMLQVVDFLDRNRVTKGEKLVVVGGGITQDIGAFASGIFKRGIPWTLFPTTLLSQSDSCVGGKTGLNYKSAKNQLAIFSTPRKIIINPHFLRTLSSDDLLSGLGEVLKLHITGGPELLRSYQQNIQDAKNLSLPALKTLIFGALGVKRAVVEEDEFELGYRKSMNYGHTLGHAIEALSEYAIPHGLAIVAGMILINELSHRRKLLSFDEKKLLMDLSFDLLTPQSREVVKHLPVTSLLDLLQKDKKTTGQEVSFVVLHGIGDMRFLPLTIDSQLQSELAGIFAEVFG